MTLDKEFEEMQRIREIWNDRLSMLKQVYIPLIFGVGTLSLTQLPNFESPWDDYFAITVGIVILLFFSFFILTTQYYDGEIVALYPRMLELENDLKWEFLTAYFFRHLGREAKIELATLLTIPQNELTECNRDFRRFKDLLNTNPSIPADKKNVQEVLLEVWDNLQMRGKQTVSTRGWNRINGLILTLVILIIIWSVLYAILN